jgi:rare lipoprotein A
MKTGGFYKMQVLKLQAKGYGVQIAGYSDYQSVTQQLFAIQKNWFKGATVFVDELNGQPYYKILLGPLNTKAEAESYRKSLIKKYGTKDAFVVDVAALSEAKNKTNSATSSDGNLLEEAKKMTAGGYYKMQVLQLESKGYGVQAMGYSDYQAVVNQLAVLQENWFSGAAIFVDELNGKPYYKIILGATDTKEKAANYAANLKKKYESMKGAFVVDITALTKKK